MSARLRALQRTIHAAAREMGIDDDDRRALQLAATGQASTAAMGEAQLRAVVEALRARGWRPRARGRAAAPRADLRYAHVLWRLLAEAKQVTPGREALNLFARKRFGAAWGAAPIDVDAMRDGRQIADLVEALKAMCARAGIRTTRRASGATAPRGGGG